MDEEKAAAYYDELSRKGGGAARFKQGLGFAADSDSNQPKSSSSSFLSNFVRASQSQSQSQISHSHSTPTKDKEIDIETERHSQLENVRNKLTKKANNTDRPRVRVRDRDQRDADTRNRTETHKHRGRSRSPERSRRSGGEERDRRHRSPIKQSRRSRSRSRSRERKSKCNDSKAVDLIPGYHNMSPAERVKANIRLQLSQAAHNDTNTGIGSWERFHFDKDAPLDDAHDLSVAADDDAALVNQFGQTFRFTSLQANREDQIKNAHDQAIFGVPQPNQSCTSPTQHTSNHDDKFDNTLTDHDHTPTSLMNQKVLSKQQGSWRDRARRNVA